MTYYAWNAAKLRHYVLKLDTAVSGQPCCWWGMATTLVPRVKYLLKTGVESNEVVSNDMMLKIRLSESLIIISRCDHSLKSQMKFSAVSALRGLSLSSHCC